MIKIGEDSIFEYKSAWTILTLKNEFYFKTKKEAIDYYCQNCCNPIYNDIHYDCESCPIKEE